MTRDINSRKLPRMTNNQSINHKLGRSSASIIVFAVNKNRGNPVAEACKSRHRDLHGRFIRSQNPGISKVPKWSDDDHRRIADQLVDQKTDIVALSITEAEYIASCEGAKMQHHYDN
jgi:hypothetical protein